MKSKQDGLSPMVNVGIGITNIGAALKLFYMAESADLNTFVQLLEMNASLTRHLKESHGKNFMLFDIVKTLGGSAPRTHNTTEADQKDKNGENWLKR